MSKEINTDKKTVKDYLKSGALQQFVIPDYQRPYAWGNEQIETLFNDLKEFTTENISNKRAEYFLGPVVAFENENGEQEIIDGQQRMTSLFLLLRAFYTHLSNAETQNDMVTYSLRKIEGTIWQTDPLTGKVNYSCPLITSKVLDQEGVKIFNNILETGVADEKATDKYSKNYILFQTYIRELSENEPMSVYYVIQAILNKVILLPITADSQDAALTIFTTLNNRGLQLSDADIFKAKLYSHAEDKAEFVKFWKSLDKEAAGADESIQKLFYYYLFYIRALDGDNKSTTPGLRKYYSQKNFKHLYSSDLLGNLEQSLILWRVVNKHEIFEGEEWSQNIGILQALDILRSYPNEFWKYPVEIYYLKYHLSDTFVRDFELFLHKLIRVLLSIYLVSPSVTTIKGDIVKLNIAILESPHPSFAFKKNIDEKEVGTKLIEPHVNAVRMLLKILAYQEEGQNELLPDNWEIEHIFPQTWQTSYFPDYPDDEIKEMIEHFGNKLPFEKKLNIIAGNGYFAKKKIEYLRSNIKITKAMGEMKLNEWGLYDIRKRDEKTSKIIQNVLKDWDDEYNDNESSNLV